jgi:hypothetical protein
MFFVVHRYEMEEVIVMSSEMQIGFAGIAMADGSERVRSWIVEVVDERVQPRMFRMKMQG